MVVLVGVLLDEGVEAVDVASRASVHCVRKAAERGALRLALARDVSLPTVAAVDGTKDGLDDLLAASTREWGGEFKLCGVKVVNLRVVLQASRVELMREAALVHRLNTLLAFIVAEYAGEEVEGLAILHVALAREILLADFARLGLLNSGRPNTLVLILGVPFRSLVGPGRDFRELQGQPSAGSSALAALSSFASFATCAATSNCADKVVGRGRLVSLQLVLRRKRLECFEEILKNRNRKSRVFALPVELCQIIQLSEADP
jgi:hypothetical protein